jgi:hypothetical protein
MNRGVLYWASDCESLCYAEPMVVNHGVLFWSSGCEVCCVILSQWLWIMLCYAAPVVVKHGELCWANGCESWCAMLVVGNHGVLCWGSGCESWCAKLNQWLWIMVCSAEPVVVNHGELCITRHDSHPLAQYSTHNSQPLAQNNSPWLTNTCTAKHTMINSH